jgi:ATP synthase protein I
MSEEPPTEGLEDFDTRLKRLQAETRPPERKRATDEPTSGMGMAFSIAAHMVAGVGLGAFVGYWLDRWLGTSPWLLIVFFFLGSAAGMLNVYRTVTGIDMAMGYRPPAGDKKSDTRGIEGPNHRADN